MHPAPAPKSFTSFKKIRHIPLDSRHPPVTLADLGAMLEIDLVVLGDKDAFRNRIKKAIQAAYREGQAFVTRLGPKPKAKKSGAGSRN